MKELQLTLDQSLYRGILLQPMENGNSGVGNEEKGTERFIRGKLSNADLFQAVFTASLLSYCKFTGMKR